jgi:hypothetical protein
MQTKDGRVISAANTQVVSATEYARDNDAVILVALDTGVPSEDGDGTWGELLHLN